jgi:CheY-like chemotaxis protein
MKFPSLETVRLMKPRLGFGSPEVCTEPDTEIGGGAPTPAVDTTQEETPVSLVRLAEHLEQATEKLDPESEPAPVELPPVEPPKAQTPPLEGRKVAAIGFGRQDIAGLASAMLEERARIQFLPHGDLGQAGEFDLYLLNCSSSDVMKRDPAFLRAILSSGVPAVAVGSRAALAILRSSGDPRLWDFAARPLHMDELVWRAANLIVRCEEARVPRVLPRRVVVADHDPFTRSLVESALARHGFTCELVEDGAAAWEAVGRAEPGVVVLDLTLPNRDGFQLMADIRRMNGRKPKVVVLSARQSEADILRAFALGADDYITKPFSPLELHARLIRLVGETASHA